MRSMLSERQAAGYPPFTREISIILRDHNQERLLKASEALYRALYPLVRRGVAASALSGGPAGASSGGPAGAAAPDAFSIFPPLAPPVAMVAGEHRLCVRLLLPKDRRLAATKRAVLDAVRRFSQTYPGRISLDVDPA